MDWQDITRVPAPTDRWILVWCGDGWWHEIVKWDDVDREWRNYSGSELHENHPPTHWCDLTKP